MFLYLIRHGHDDDTIRGGWNQHPLSDHGRQQSHTLAQAIWQQREFFQIQQIYSSDLPRAVETAQILADKLELQVSPIAAFRETNNGELAGMDNLLAAKQYPGLYWNTLQWEQRYPGGESPKEFYERISCAWNELQRKLLVSRENVVLVTHGGVIQVILSLIEGVPYCHKQGIRKVKNAEMICFEYKNSGWREIPLEYFE